MPARVPVNASSVMKLRAREIDSTMAVARFRSECQALVAELAYLRPEDPFAYLKEWFDDHEGPIPMKCHTMVQEQVLTASRPEGPDVVEAYMILHEIRPFLEAIGEKLTLDGPQENIKQYIKEHLDWGVGNIKRASLGKHFERNQWRLKPKKELDEGSAATVIQSGFRAKRSRQRVKKVRRAKNNEYDDECELAAVKMQTVARGRQSRKRVKKIKHKKEMEAMGYTDDHEEAATKIQSIGRSKKAKKRVQAQREAKERERQLRELAMNEQDAAALKIQGVARKRNAKNRVKRKRDAKRREEEMKDDGKE
jgi:hypothetical protein